MSLGSAPAPDADRAAAVSRQRIGMRNRVAMGTPSVGVVRTVASRMPAVDPPPLQDLDFGELTAPGAPEATPAPVTPRIEDDALIGTRSLEQAGYHVVVARERGRKGGGKGLVLVVEDD